jgi:hypothetical protein
LRAYEIKIPHPLRGVGEIDYGIVRQVCAVRQAELGEARELMLAPSLKAVVSDSRATRQVNLLEP